MSKVSPTPDNQSIGGWPAIDALNWAFSHLASKDMLPGDKLVLMAMAAHVEGDDYVVWQPEEAIAELVGSDPATVIGAIGRLAADGLIRFAGRFHATDASPVYTLELGR